MFELTIVTPTKSLVEKKPMEEVYVPGHRGELNILPGHSPLLTTLTEGVLRYRLKGESQDTAVAISWGYCHITPYGVKILAETAERAEEIDLERAKESLKKAEDELDNLENGPKEVERYHHKRMRAEARIAVATEQQHH